MSSTLPRVDGPADAELISAVRGGDLDAYGELFERHVGAARRLARQLTSSGDADDLVSEAFTKVLGVLQRGGGPDVAFRAYLLTAVRRLHIDKIRAGSRVQPTDDIAAFDPGVPFRDVAVEGFENAAAARAFSSLPERWQLVLWHTEVEGSRPADIAPLLGMSANSVSALAYRAREGLRQAFLTMHQQDIEDDACEFTHRHLGGYVRQGLSRRDANRVEEHLSSCRKCSAIYLELRDVNSNLAGILGPLLLGGAAAGYLASAAVVPLASSLFGTAAGRVRDLVTTNAAATAVVGVTSVALVAGGAYGIFGGGADRTLQGGDTPPGPIIVATSSAPADPTTARPDPGLASLRAPTPTRGRTDSRGPSIFTPPPLPGSTTAAPSATIPVPTGPASTSQPPTTSGPPTSTPSTSPTRTPSPTRTTSIPTASITPTPTATPTTTASPTVTVNPTPTEPTGPTGSPTPTETPPTDSPSPTETTPTVPPEPDPFDATLGVAVDRTTPGWDIVVSLSGMSETEPSILHLSTEGGVDLYTSWTGCRGTGDRTAVCDIDGGPARTIIFQAAGSPGEHLTFRLEPGPGAPDPDLSNNSVTVVLEAGPRPWPPPWSPGVGSGPLGHP